MCPADSATHAHVTDGRNATKMFEATAMKSARDGLFAASCLLHTGFTLDGPIIKGVNAIQALWNWLHDNSTKTPTDHKFLDECRDDKFFPPCGSHCPLTP
jgi:hypothetical protein